jgi:anti-sigma regulatory factor (Ser/Thr protein kinase)
MRTTHAIVRVSAQPGSVGDARRAVAATLGDWGLRAIVDVVVLLVSELVVNVIVHAGPHAPGEDVVVDLSATDGRVRVEVADGSAALAVLADRDVASPSGRGLRVVEALADAWGVAPRGKGKMVWFEVDGSEVAGSDRERG